MTCFECNEDVRLCRCPDIEARLRRVIATGNAHAQTWALDGLLARLEYQRDWAKARAAALNRRLQAYRAAYRETYCETTALRLQRAQAQRHMLRMLDGTDKEQAQKEAREWLVTFFKGEANYQLMVRIENEHIPRLFAEMKTDAEAAQPAEVFFE